ncbi:MAG TPA: hypothetical protein VFD29_11525 [Gillisia sp.]|nr:hypothetical protein [Gillisia sp.]
MDLQDRKKEFIREFLKLQNEKTVLYFEKLLKKELLEANLKPMTPEQFNHEIDQSLEDSKNDRVIKATDLKAKIREWH